MLTPEKHRSDYASFGNTHRGLEPAAKTEVSDSAAKRQAVPAVKARKRFAKRLWLTSVMTTRASAASDDEVFCSVTNASAYG